MQVIQFSYSHLCEMSGTSWLLLPSYFLWKLWKP